MFSFFRRRDTAVRYLLGGLLLMVCLSMVAYLIPGITTSSSTEDASVLAKVAGDTVTTADLQHQLQMISSTNRVPASMLPFYAPRVFDQLVSEKATLYEARRLGLAATQNEIIDVLRQNSAFFPGGQFIGADRYREMIEERAKMTVTQFEDNLRDSILADKLRSLVTDSVVISDADLDREYRDTNDKIKLDYVLLKPGDFTSEVKVNEDELKAFFEKNRNDYKMPEKRNLKIVYLDLDKVRENVDVSDAEIRQWYDRNKNHYRVEDSVQVSQILIKTVGKPPDQVKEAEKKIGELLQKVRGGEDFANVARQNSEDTTSQPKGGDLGWITKGMAGQEFEKAAFSMDPGKISDVIKTQIGFVIIKVSGRKRAHQQTLDEMRVQIVQELKQDKGERVSTETTGRFETAVRRAKNLEALAAEMKLPVIEAPNHALGDAIPALGGAPPTLDQAAFQLKAGETSGAVTIGKNEAVVRADQIMPQRPAELAEVRIRVENDYRTQKASEIMKSRAADLVAKAKSLSDVKKAATALKLTAKTSDPLARDGRIQEAGSVPGFPESAFVVKPGDITGPVVFPAGLMVYSVTEQMFAAPEVVAMNRATMRGSMIEGRRNAAFDLYMTQLKARLTKEGRLITYDTALKRFTSSLQ